MPNCNYSLINNRLRSLRAIVLVGVAVTCSADPANPEGTTLAEALVIRAYAGHEAGGRLALTSLATCRAQDLPEWATAPMRRTAWGSATAVAGRISYRLPGRWQGATTDWHVGRAKSTLPPVVVAARLTLR